MRDGDRGKHAVLVVEAVVETHLGVQEVKRGAVAGHVDRHLVVVRAHRLEAHAPVLELGLRLQAAVLRTLHEAGKHIAVQLQAVAVVVGVVRRAGGGGVLRPDHPAEVVALVAVGGGAQRQGGAVPSALRPEDGAVEIVVEPAAAHQVGGRHRVVAHHHIGQQVIGEVLAGFELLEVALPVREVAGGGQAPIAELVLEVELLMVLAIVVDLILVGVVVGLATGVDQVVNLAARCNRWRPPCGCPLRSSFNATSGTPHQLW